MRTCYDRRRQRQCGGHAANAALDAGGAVRLARAQPHRRRLGCRRGVAVPRAAGLGDRSHPQPARLCQHASAERRKHIWDQTVEGAATSGPSGGRCAPRARRPSRRSSASPSIARNSSRPRGGRPRLKPRPGRGAGPLRQGCRRPDAAGAARLPTLARAAPPARPQSAGRARPPGRRADPAVGGASAFLLRISVAPCDQRPHLIPIDCADPLGSRRARAGSFTTRIRATTTPPALQQLEIRHSA